MGRKRGKDATRRKKVLITGSGSGIGRSTAITLARRGHIVLATTHDEEGAEMLNKMAEGKGITLQSFKLDVTLPADRQKVLDNDIDVLINNAGIGESGSLTEIDIDRVRHNFEVNVFGPLELTQLALKDMMRRDRGTIIFISSLAGRVSMPFLGPYGMTKSALSNGVTAMRRELSMVTSNVHVVLVEPGIYHTGFNQETISKKYGWMGERSYFHAMIEQLRSDEEFYLNLAECHSTKSIITKIVAATEASRPRHRYVAPWWQGFLVQMARMLGM